MKLKTLKISNILCFEYYLNISSCPPIKFKDGLNILIGTNGSGKTTVLEVINCLLTRVLFQPYSLNEQLLLGNNGANNAQVIQKGNNHYSYQGLRLHKNRNSMNKPSQIEIEIEMDDIDKTNMKNLVTNKNNILNIAKSYSPLSQLASNIPSNYIENDNILTIQLILDANHNMKVESGITNDFRFQYLNNFEFYRNLIFIYNRQNKINHIEPLTDPFIMLSGYRNYNQFTNAVSLVSMPAAQQIESLRQSAKQKSINAIMPNEPEIFTLVRLALAKKHFDIALGGETLEQKIYKTNNQDFILKINEKLRIINLKLEIEFVSQATWSYQFKIIDTLTDTTLTDINHLSSGQKAILHLILESYGRGPLNGGLIIIDEPELHLHYQFEYEFLSLIEYLIKKHKTQSFLVTHSESLINSKTIESVIRFTLNSGTTKIYSPRIETIDKWRVKILDNCRSINAFFCDKIILVEGEDDRYFFREAINFIYPDKRQYIFILDVQGKDKFDVWKDFFEKFGLRVYIIADLDHAFSLYQVSNPPKLFHKEVGSKKNEMLITDFRKKYSDIDNKIDKEYKNDLFILKHGALEQYLGIHNKGLSEVIRFCREKLPDLKGNNDNSKYVELKNILKNICEN